MFHHPLFQIELDVHLKLQIVRDSELLLIHRLTQVSLKMPTVVERVVKFDTLGTTFIPRIFEAEEWADLFENFEDLIEELVKEFYSNARYTGVELKYWV